MIAHDNLRAVRDHNLRLRYAPCHQLLNLFDNKRDVQGYAISEYIDTFRMAHSAWKSVKREFAVFIYDRMTGVCSALISDYYIGTVRECVNDLSFSLVTPVGSNYSLYHDYLLL